MKQLLWAALLGSTALIPSIGIAQTATTAPAAPAGAAQANPCPDLVTFIERRGTAATPASPVTLDQARGFQRANDAAACRDALTRIRTAGIELPANLAAMLTTASATGAAATTPGAAERIIVQQPAATLQVEQAPPQVSVTQAQPQVTVRQQQPEIIVRQAPPTITVQMPNPEIIVRMPEPEVNVVQAQPQVQVQVSPPTVSMNQPTAQPQVQVQPSQAQVTVQAPQAVAGQSNVTVERGAAPTVRFERQGEARVVMNQQEGQPNIRFEPMGGAGAGAPAAGAAAPVRATGDAAATAGAAVGGAMNVQRINDLNVYGSAGERLGDVDRVVQTTDGKAYAVVGFGGFLGLGERKVAIPVEQLALRGDRLVVTTMTTEQLRALPAFDAGTTYRDAATSYVPTFGR